MGKFSKAPGDVSSSEAGTDEGKQTPEERAQAREEWLISIIDILASEYHWSKAQILEEVYPEEVEVYARKIGERRIQEAQEKVHDYRMLLKIALAPYAEKGRGATELLQYLDTLEKRLQKPLERAIEYEDHIVKALRDHRDLFG